MDLDRMVVLAIGLVAASVPGSVSRETPPVTAQRPALSGRWRINGEKSEDGAEKLRAAAGGRRPGGSGPGGSGPGGSGRAGGGFGGRGAGRRGGGPGRGAGDMRDSMRRLTEAPAEMTITQTETEIAIAEKDGRLRLLHPDGEPYKDSTGGEVRTRWVDDRLVVDTRLEGGPKVSETFSLDAPTRQLVIESRFEGRLLGDVTVRRVYEPEAPE
jgi:hypothetical protein